MSYRLILQTVKCFLAYQCSAVEVCQGRVAACFGDHGRAMESTPGKNLSCYLSNLLMAS